MNTFEDAVQAAKDAKTSIAALEKAEALDREALATLRVEFARKEQALIDSVALCQKQAHEARAALQSALQRINDAPIEEQAAAQPAEILEPLPTGSLYSSTNYDEEVEPREDPGFEPLTDQGQALRDGVSLY